MDELLEYRRRMLICWWELPQVFLNLCNEPATGGNGTIHAQRLPLLAYLSVTEEQVFAKNIHMILDEDSPSLPFVETPHWTKMSYVTYEPVDVLLNKYVRQRMLEKMWVEQMPLDGWNRCGRHPVYGMKTLLWWVEQSLVHGLNCLDVIKTG